MELSKDVKAYLKLRKKLMVLEYAGALRIRREGAEGVRSAKGNLLQVEKNL